MTTENNILEMTADSVGRDLLQALVTELKLLPKPWVALTKAKQDDVIDRLRSRVEYQIKMAVHVLASDGRTTIAADLEQVTAKDGIKAQFKISQASQGRHDLFDSVGRACLIVLANAEDHTGGMNEIQGEHDQRAMDLGREYTDNDGDGMPDDDVVDAEIREVPAIEQQPLQADLDQAYLDGRIAAEEGKAHADCPVMAGPLCIQWIKGWKDWHEEQREPEASDENQQD